jgi:hypothetical protein
MFCAATTNKVAGISAYWKLEKLIRKCESASGSVIGATGALYAVRRSLIPRLPTGTLLDDVYVPLWVIRQGKRVIFEPKARAWDELSNGTASEFGRHCSDARFGSLGDLEQSSSISVCQSQTNTTCCSMAYDCHVLQRLGTSGIQVLFGARNFAKSFLRNSSNISALAGAKALLFSNRSSSLLLDECCCRYRTAHLPALQKRSHPDMGELKRKFSNNESERNQSNGVT